MKKWQLSRRHYLRGMSNIAIGLPFLECMIHPTRTYAQNNETPNFLVLVKPNGEDPTSWRMNNQNQLPYVLSPFENIRSDVTFLNNFNNSPSGDGHGEMLTRFLSCGRIFGGNQASKTIDNIIGDTLNIPQTSRINLTQRYAFDVATNGLSASYFQNLSWDGKEKGSFQTPRQFFDQIFGDITPGSGSGNPSPTPLSVYQKNRRSILDFVLSEAKSLNLTLGQADQAKMDEYLTGIREIERGLDSIDETTDGCADGFPKIEDFATNNKVETFNQHVSLMLDLLLKALQCGKAPISTFLMDFSGGSGGKLPNGRNMDHHPRSHYTCGACGDGGGYVQSDYFEVNHWYSMQAAAFLETLKNTAHGSSNLLDSSIVLYGSPHGNTRQENHERGYIQLILAGKGNGRLNPSGQSREFNNAPLANLMLTLLKTMGVNQNSLGNSQGTISGL